MSGEGIGDVWVDVSGWLWACVYGTCVKGAQQAQKLERVTTDVFLYSLQSGSPTETEAYHFCEVPGSHLSLLPKTVFIHLYGHITFYVGAED